MIRKLLLVTVCSLVFFWYRSHVQSPIMDLDSWSYIRESLQILEGRWPNWSFRTPVYPIFLIPSVLTKNYSVGVWMSIFLASGGAIVFLRIINKLSPKTEKLNWWISLLLWIDFGIANFQNIILVESIAPTVMCLFLAANLRIWENKEKISWWMVVGADVILMYLKPSFLLLPFIVKLFFAFCDKSFRKWKMWMLFDLVLILALPAYNLVTMGNWQISEVKIVNSLGIIIRNGYLSSDVPKEAEWLKNTFESTGKKSDPWVIINKVAAGELPGVDLEKVAITTSRLLKYNWKDYFYKVFVSVSQNFNFDRWFYATPDERLKSNWLFLGLNSFYDYLNIHKWWGFLSGLVIWSWWWRKGNKKAVYLGVVLISCGYLMLVNTAFSYDEYFRLRQPVEAWLNLLVLLPFLYIRI